MSFKCSGLNAHLCYDCNDLILYEYVRVWIPRVVGVAHVLSWSDTIIFLLFFVSIKSIGTLRRALNWP